MFRWTKQQPEAHSGHQGSAPSMVPNDGLDLLTITDFIGSHDRRHVEAAIRRRCHTVWIDPETTLCRILGRYKFFVDSRDIGLAPHLMLDGYWEFWISDFIWRNLRPGFRVLDVGANLGYYTVLAADLVGPQGQVTAFEPNPRMFELLQRNAGINGFSQWTDCSARAVSCRIPSWARSRLMCARASMS